MKWRMLNFIMQCKSICDFLYDIFKTWPPNDPGLTKSDKRLELKKYPFSFNICKCKCINQ